MNVKLAVGGGLIAFLIGAVFWAGATYNRMGNMEQSLAEIKIAIAALNKVPLLELRLSEVEQDIKQLQEERYEKLLTPNGVEKK